MLKQLKKLPHYVVKFLKKGSLFEFIEILKQVEIQHLMIAWAARLDHKPVVVKFRNQPQPILLSTYFELIKHRKKRMVEDLYEWDYLQEKMYGTLIQMIGLHAEYFSGLFEDIYNYSWKGKTVLDIGGFVGDTALFFLKKGAKKVIIFEPLSKNILASQHNLSEYQDQIEIHQKAVSDKEGKMILSSDEPEGGLGFGSKKGGFQIECEGISISKILENSPHVDVLKMDCEGGEKYLLDLQAKKIQSIPYWIVETHSNNLYEQIPRKFHECGFKQVYETCVNDKVYLFHFERISHVAREGKCKLHE